MLLYHTERVIQIDIILSPTLTAPSERRVRAAIEVCRIIAGVENMMADKGGIGQYFQGLNNAGIVFDPRKYPNGPHPSWWVLIVEFNWVVDKLVEVDRLTGYDSGRTLVNILRETWSSENPWETYRRLSRRSAPSWYLSIWITVYLIIMKSHISRSSLVCHDPWLRGCAFFSFWCVDPFSHSFHVHSNPPYRHCKTPSVNGILPHSRNTMVECKILE